MLVRFHFDGDEDVTEYWPDSTASADLQHRAVDLGCPMYTPEVWHGDDSVDLGGIPARVPGRVRLGGGDEPEPLRGV